MPTHRRRLLLSGLLLAACVPALRAEPALRDGDLLLFRHALAPGGGDPPGFRFGDCASQRGLSDEGRAQARRLGESLRARLSPLGLQVGAVWSSPWCRTRDTAALAFPGRAVVEQAAFGSTFGEPGREPAQTRAAQALLAAWRGPGLLVVLTHQVNITALSGVFPASGEGVAMRWRDGQGELLGRLPAP